jgi:hypothetical protein
MSLIKIDNMTVIEDGDREEGSTQMDGLRLIMFFPMQRMGTFTSQSNDQCVQEKHI